MHLPATPKDLLAFILNYPEPPESILKIVNPHLEGFSKVTAIILLSIWEHGRTGAGPATTATVMEITGRNVSTSQLETLLKKGHLQRHSVKTVRTIAFAWSIAPATVPIIDRMDMRLRRIIATTNHNVRIHIETVKILADFVGGEPAKIHGHHTLGQQLGIDFATDHDLTTNLFAHFNLPLKTHELTPLVTVADLIRHLQHRLAESTKHQARNHKRGRVGSGQ